MTNFLLNKSSPNQFQMVLNLPDSLIQRMEITFNELTLNIFSTVVPSISLNDNEEHWQGHLHHRIVGNLEYTPFDVSFLIDEDWNNWKVFYNWLNLINNNNDTHGLEKSSYTVDSSILIFDNYNSLILKINLKNLFPLSLGEVSLNNRDGENFLESSVNLIYDYYEYEI